MSDAIPEGFVSATDPVGFDKQFGAMYINESGETPILGFRIKAHHLNFSGSLHGGALAVFADWQCVPAKLLANTRVHTPTISLSIDYLEPAFEGDWLEMHARLDKRTGRMLFSSADFVVGEKLIARSTAIYRLTKAEGVLLGV